MNSTRGEQKLELDNYVIYELFFREDHPEYFSEKERTYEAVVEYARVQRELAESALKEGADTDVQPRA